MALRWSEACLVVAQWPLEECLDLRPGVKW